MMDWLGKVPDQAGCAPYAHALMTGLVRLLLSRVCC